MTILRAVLLGLLQGLTEFLPVSSSAHLLLAQNWQGSDAPQLTFSMAVHLGTLFAVCLSFRREIGELCGAVFTGSIFRRPKEEQSRLFWLLFLSLLPLLLIYPFNDLLDPLLLSPSVAGICLLFNGLILLLCDLAPSGSKTAGNMKKRDALFVGILQGFALLPGLSRSGTTVTAGVCRGLDRAFAAKFSFLLSIPTILGGALSEGLEVLETGLDPAFLVPCLWGTAAAALSGFCAISLLKYLLRSKKFFYFALYTFALGVITLLSETL